MPGSVSGTRSVIVKLAVNSKQDSKHPAGCDRSSKSGNVHLAVCPFGVSVSYLSHLSQLSLGSISLLSWHYLSPSKLGAFFVGKLEPLSELDFAVLEVCYF